MNHIIGTFGPVNRKTCQLSTILIFIRRVMDEAHGCAMCVLDSEVAPRHSLGETIFFYADSLFPLPARESGTWNPHSKAKQKHVHKKKSLFLGAICRRSSLNSRTSDGPYRLYCASLFFKFAHDVVQIISCVKLCFQILSQCRKNIFCMN